MVHMPFHPVTVGLKIGRSASRRSACSSPSFSGNDKSQMEREGGVSEARTTKLSSRRTSTRSACRTPQRRLVSARPVLHQRAMVRAEGTAFHLGVFSLDSKISELRIFCVCHHDETTKNRSKNSLQLTERQQKRKRGKFRAKRGEKSGVFQSYKWTAAA